jgi:hypothetical protein
MSVLETMRLENAKARVAPHDLLIKCTDNDITAA